MQPGKIGCFSSGVLPEYRLFMVTLQNILNGNDTITVGGTLGFGNGPLLTCDMNVVPGHAIVLSSTNAPKCTDGGANPSVGRFVYGVARGAQSGGSACGGSFVYSVLVIPHWVEPGSSWSYRTSASYTFTGSDGGTTVIGPVTVDTPSVNQWYKVSAQVVLSNTPASCSSGSATVSVQLD
jgi:hypothetical protein